MKTPLVSIVIPTYDRLKYTLDAVESAKHQTYSNIEIIVVDDGSTDGTYEALHEKYNSEIKVIKKINGGASTARNIGIGCASGEYIAYLDSDDLWDRRKIEIFVEMLSIIPEAEIFIFSDFKRRLKTQELSSQTNSQIFPHIYKYFRELDPERKLYVARDEKLFKCILQRYPFYPSTFFISKSLHEQYRWDTDMVWAEDFYLVARLSKDVTFYYIDKPLTVIRMHSSNISYNVESAESSHYQALKMLRIMNNSDSTRKDMCDFAIADHNYLVGRHLLKAGRIFSGIKYIILSMMNYDLWSEKLRLKGE